jgi:Skp family chaperone for outer membrane proteins
MTPPKVHNFLIADSKYIEIPYEEFNSDLSFKRSWFPKEYFKKLREIKKAVKDKNEKFNKELEILKND